MVGEGRLCVSGGTGGGESGHGLGEEGGGGEVGGEEGGDGGAGGLQGMAISKRRR